MPNRLIISRRYAGAGALHVSSPLVSAVWTTPALTPLRTKAGKRASRRLRHSCVSVEAGRAPRRTRLVTRILSVPRRIDQYFAGRVLRQLLWTAIAFCAGFYAANVVSLSFGAIAVNDVIAAVFTVAFVEIVGKIYYSAEKVDLKLIFLNSFKMGVCAALIADALKLGG